MACCGCRRWVRCTSAAVIAYLMKNHKIGHDFTLWASVKCYSHMFLAYQFQNCNCPSIPSSSSFYISASRKKISRNIKPLMSSYTSSMHLPTLPWSHRPIVGCFYWGFCDFNLSCSAKNQSRNINSINAEPVNCTQPCLLTVIYPIYTPIIYPSIILSISALVHPATTHHEARHLVMT